MYVGHSGASGDGCHSIEDGTFPENVRYYTSGIQSPEITAVALSLSSPWLLRDGCELLCELSCATKSGGDSRMLPDSSSQRWERISSASQA